ncbi:MAG: acyltransferase [Candidatus Pristimantibacillus lignocellulolyticus]|uniref:Acyltransferase n=1 Tax=Candidatus Pristimantibacillus lignocellulolyticus TaxID=2994561 RepID=A0A9J6ZCY1_9BACL|nr:MAG: acyltransferase [Candidatus Pristimantibacillus lignocellulolyticus]
MKKILKRSFILISKCIMPLFYDKQYLQGRWFDNAVVGWRWCWRSLLFQKILGSNRHVPFPVSHNNAFGNTKNLKFDTNDLNNFQHHGCYFQTWGNAQIRIGKGSYIAPNVGLITQNHDVHNLDNHIDAKDINIGDNCWIGMNAVILPGVVLGDKTIVGAGAVVTKSFPFGNCVIGGVPAKKIKQLD